MLEYIDVRGPWPVYICGMRAYELRGCKERLLTVEVAKAVVAAMQA